jgi:hypothetical protein
LYACRKDAVSHTIARRNRELLTASRQSGCEILIVYRQSQSDRGVAKRDHAKHDPETDYLFNFHDVHFISPVYLFDGSAYRTH